MNIELGKLYGTPGLSHAAAAQEEDLQKQASIELFAKLAADNNIDLSSLTDTAVAQLWDETFGTKIAELPPQFAANMKGKGDKKGEEHEEKDEKKDEKEDKEKKAAAELATAQEGEMKIAMADRMGRHMAHAFVNELEQINVARTKEAAAKTAGEIPAAATPAAVAPTVKVASPLDQLAVDVAVKLAGAEGLDVGEVTRKLAARHELGGFAPSTKIASVPQGDLSAATNVRALELLEQAGYPIKWA